MRILITGAFGFIGTALVHQLAQDGDEVTALTTRPRDEVPTDTPVARIVHGSLLDQESLRTAVKGAEAVVHLAALTKVRESFDREREYVAVNTDGTSALLQATEDEMNRTGLPVRLVFTSTGALYDTSAPQPFTESSPLNPTNPYTQSKERAEEAIQRASRALTDAPMTILRPFNVAGASHGRGDSDLSRIIPKTLAVAAGHAPMLQVNGDGSALRDFVHVADVARAIAAALRSGTPGSARVYNVGSTATSVSEIIDVCGKVTGRAIPAEYHPPKPEPQALLSNCTAIRRDLNWTPLESYLSTIVTDAWNAMGARA